MAMDMSSPPTLSDRRHSPSMSLDLSDLPALSSPAPPTNTLIITNLQSLEIFTASVLDGIQKAINEHAAIHTFSPLKSFRRIIVSFYSEEDAVAIRKVLDGESVLGNRVRVYFGQETKINPEDQHLQAPKSDKLFFISPPPSPPMGWEMRNEEAPNKEVHAEDLAEALGKLHARPGPDDAMMQDSPAEEVQFVSSRPRSGTGTIVYHPKDHGHSPELPAISVEDTTASPGDLSPMEGVEKKFAHTARPPVELME